jgi:hypothetical protein
MGHILRPLMLARHGAMSGAPSSSDFQAAYLSRFVEPQVWLDVDMTTK